MAKKSLEQGFTLIELLVVIIIIGILSAIALPSFLGQAAKARQSEAKLTVGSGIKAQNVYYLENQTFTSDCGEMGVGLYKETPNYKYDLLRSSVKNEPLNEQIILATPRNKDLRAYIGAVQVVERSNNPTVVSVLCEAKKPLVELSEKSIVFGERDVKCSSEAREVR